MPTAQLPPDPYAPPPPGQPVAPPSISELAQHVAEILLAGYALHKAAELIAALLRPWKVSVTAVAAALGLASHAVKPRPQFAPHGLDPRDPALTTVADIVRKAAADDAYFRAAYVVRCSMRLQRELDAGHPLRESLAAERRFYDQHRDARDNRQEHAAEVARAASLFGPILGWHRNHASDSEAECLAADGHNFRADQPPLIGYPGTVHPHCRCIAGPPHATRVSVDQAVSAALGLTSTTNGQRPTAKVPRRAG